LQGQSKGNGPFAATEFKHILARKAAVRFKPFVKDANNIEMFVSIDITVAPINRPACI